MLMTAIQGLLDLILVVSVGFELNQTLSIFAQWLLLLF